MAVATVPTVKDMLNRVTELEPLLREHAEEQERNRELSVPVAEALRDGGFFRMIRPQSRNGLGFDPVSAFRVVEALARIDSAAGWCVQVSNAGEPFGAWFPDETTEEVYGSPDTVSCGAFNPKGRAVPVEGGYRYSGSTSFNSNCKAADWYLSLANIYDSDGDEPRNDENGDPVTLLTLIPMSEVEIVDNWDTLGMRGTGSHDVRFSDVFLPEHRAALFVPLEEPSPAYDTPFARLTTWPVNALQAVPSLGVAQAAIDDLIELGLKVPAYTERALRNRSSAQYSIARASGILGAARTFLHNTFDDAWQHAAEGEWLNLEQKAQCQLAMTHTVIAAAEAVDLVHACVGASGLRNEYKFQRYFRDVHSMTQHAFICAARLENIGQIMFDVDCDWTFFDM